MVLAGTSRATWNKPAVGSTPHGPSFQMVVHQYKEDGWTTCTTMGLGLFMGMGTLRAKTSNFLTVPLILTSIQAVQFF